MKTFEYRGTSSADFGIICEAISRPILPALRPRIIEIYGRSGVIDYGGGDYGTTTIALQITYVGNDAIEMQQRTRAIGEWLSSIKFEKLIVSDETDKYYLGRVINGIDFKTLNRLGRANIVFECQPFAYMVADTGIDPTWETSDFPWILGMPWDMGDNYTFSVSDTGGTFEFENPGTVDIDYKSPPGGKFNVTIDGSWIELEVSLNDKTLSIPAGTGMLVIDNIDMTVTIDEANILATVDGDIDNFLPIKAGDNTIEITGTDINATVTLEFRPQWV